MGRYERRLARRRGQTCQWREAAYLHRETPSFYSLKIRLHTGFPGSIYVGSSSSNNWVERSEVFDSDPKLKALTRNEFRVGTEAAKRGRL